ncbi:sulfatase-like hydrolase/transferase [Ferroplasma acidiphilum]|uniref:sulfatase-like hydrolase/transferase n=1 Tax=Ferroplasma acidiphilum TaxID=74969 RepID=UPI002815D5F6|nr:sulfatase-like hydrolase/transferase [Ferroplasma acidiphilum]WMT53767.1 MAG: sulfatase-like hydrolase/transferase [Ferroplasma acidiphilum]
MSKPNIIVVVFDTLRYDLFNKFVTDNMQSNENIKDFTNFENAYSTSPWTLPSHISLFTGLYPSEHGIHESPNSELIDIFKDSRKYSGKYITDIASEQGYKTIGFSANPMISELTGFNLKFDHFETIDLHDIQIFKNLHISNNKYVHKGISAIGVMKAMLFGFPRNKGYKLVLSKLQQCELTTPFFLFMNFMEVHDPYFNAYRDDNMRSLNDLFGSKKISDVEKGRLKDRYYNQIQSISLIINNLIKLLKDRKIYDNTIIILTADHGQALKEKNYYGHGIYLYDELIRIPLLIKGINSGNLMNRENSYTSLINVNSFLKSILMGEDNSERWLLTDKIFSESFGMQHSKSGLNKFLCTTESKDRYNRINTLRKALLYKGYKIVINGSNSSIDEFSSYNGNKIDYDTILKMVNYLKIFNIDNEFNLDSDQIISEVMKTYGA